MLWMYQSNYRYAYCFFFFFLPNFQILNSDMYFVLANTLPFFALFNFFFFYSFLGFLYILVLCMIIWIGYSLFLLRLKIDLRFDVSVICLWNCCVGWKCDFLYTCNLHTLEINTCPYSNKRWWNWLTVLMGSNFTL